MSLSQGVTFVVSGTLELSGSITTGKNSNIYVCGGGILVIKGNLTLGNQANILVKTGGILIVLGNVDGLQGNINLDNDGKIVLAGSTNLNESTSMSGSTGVSYIFDSSFVPKVGAGGTVGDYDDLVANDSELLEIFNKYCTPAKPTLPTATAPICQGTATSTVQTTATSGASTYAWSIVQQSGTISPGTISGTGTSATITWNPLFSGVALVGVTGVNASSTYGSPSDALSITVNPQPAPVLGSTAICAGSSIALGASGGYSSYSWTVTTTGFSLINATTPAPTLTAPDNDTLFPIGTTEIVAYPNVSVTVTDSNGCSATVTNNSTDRQVAVFRIPRTGAPYHISNVVAK